MNEAALWVFDASWKAAVAAALVLLAQTLARRLLPPWYLHALWLLVLVRLLVPIVPESPFSLFHLSSAAGLADPLPGLVVGSPGVPPPGGAPAGASGGTSFELLSVLALFWIGGVALLVVRTLITELRLRRALSRAHPVTDLGLLAELGRCRRILGVERQVELVTTPLVAGPAVSEGRRPRILLPEDFSDLEPEEIRHVLLHELAHVRRWDGVVGAVARLAALLHWFNPVVHFGLSRMSADRELACDALVLARLRPPERARYGHTLLKVLERSQPARSAAGLLCLLENKRQLKRRLLMIAKYRSPHRLAPAVFAVLLAALATLTLTNVPAIGAPEPLEPATEEAPEEATEATEATAELKTTVMSVRMAGTAMYGWLTDADRDGSVPEFGRDTSVDFSEGVDWTGCPPISYEDLTSILVPSYASELPRTDGWGNDLEFCLDRSEPPAPGLAIGVRSASADASFSDDAYAVGSFPRTATDRDIVWVDGFFVTWPD